MLRRATLRFAAAIYRNSVIVFGCVLAATVWLGVWQQIRSNYEEHLGKIAEEMNGLTTVFESHVVRTIKDLDRAMLIVRDYIEVERVRNGGAIPWDKLRLPQPEVLGDAASQVSLIDANGLIRVSNIPRNTPSPPDLAERPYFSMHRETRADTLYIGTPIFRNTLGRWTLQLTRPLRAEPRGFTGVINGALEPNQFFAIHPPIDIGNRGSISILGLDGIVRASQGATALELGANRSDLPVLKAIYNRPFGTYLENTPRGEGDNFVGYRKVEGYQLILQITKSKDEALMAHYLRRRDYCLFGGTLTLIILLGAAAGWHYQRKLQQTANDLVTREAELRVQNMRFDTALSHMGQALCMFDQEQRVVVCNERYAVMYGLRPDMTKPGTTLRQIIEHRIAKGIYYSGAGPEEYMAERVRPVTAASDKVYELTDGRVIAVSRRPMPGGGWVTTHEDITERRRIESRIAHLAHHDLLTSLPNRALFSERLDQALAGTRHSDRAFAVLMLDLDRFKEVNDSLGHSVGDALLKAVAERLRACARESDTVARLGGDEFAILQSVEDPATETAALGNRLVEAMNSPFDLAGNVVSVGTSIGIAVAPGDGEDADQLLKHADLALYRAKSEGRGSYCFFEPEMDRRMQMRCDLLRDLRMALGKGEFELYYQPLVNLESGDVCGFEALLRWNHAELGMIMPSDFIPLAEDTGLMVPIGEWVLRQACAEAVTWPAHLKVAVNVSPVQFKSRSLVSSVASALANAGLAPQRLELEITESVVLKDEDEAFATLRQLHDLHVRIGLDDFGTGYASLGTLRRFHFDKIKIDRSFVSDLSHASVDVVAILRAVARLGAHLGIATTAEGIETQEQLERVRAEGCTEVQGYYICAPTPADEIRRLFVPAIETPASAA